jgi:eukaryotic-like serine/threonine-protein kinase
VQRIVSGHGIGERYELGDVLGQGGAATVYRALDRHTGRQVAIKLYETALSTGDRPQHRAELAALVRLQHPGLVRLYDAGFHDGCAFLVMQLIDGEPLSQRIARGALPVATVVELGWQLASTLAYVHARGVIHRDVKPGNVLVDATDRCFLTDFGVSRLVDATRCTVSGLALGTPAFLAPEQVRGRRLGPAIDIYALGLVLLEALTGTKEYPGGAVESAVARLHRSPHIPPTLPARLRFLLRAMTVDDPAVRPDAATVASRLTALRDGDRTVESFSVRHGPRRFRWSVGALLLAGAAATMGVLTLSVPVDRDPVRAPVPVEHGQLSALPSVPPDVAAERLPVLPAPPVTDAVAVADASIGVPTAARPEPPPESAGLDAVPRRGDPRPSDDDASSGASDAGGEGESEGEQGSAANQGGGNSERGAAKSERRAAAAKADAGKNGKSGNGKSDD